MSDTRCGFIAVLGAANAGKSTLVNALARARVGIVSPKPQTTRTRVTAILTEGTAQLVFLDLPGVFAPRRRLDRAMVDAAWRGVAEADLTLLVVDAARPDAGLDAVLAGLRTRARATVLALNKIDLVKPPVLLGLAQRLNDAHGFAATFMVSALTGSGVDDLRAYLVAALPAGPWHYDADQLTDLPARMLAAEITREQVFRQLHQELPYSAMVDTEQWQEREDGSARIDQTIVVERDSQKRIVIGAQGSRIKAIGEAARTEMESTFGRRIHLFLNVKVVEDWAEKRALYRNWGLDYGA